MRHGLGGFYSVADAAAVVKDFQSGEASMGARHGLQLPVQGSTLA